MKTKVIYPNTNKKLKGKICVYFEAINARNGKKIRTFLPNAFTNKESTCEDIQKSFFDKKGGSHNPSVYLNCKVLKIQSM